MKLPVIRALGATLTYTTKNFHHIASVAWLPLAGYFAAAVWGEMVLESVTSDVEGASTGDPLDDVKTIGVGFLKSIGILLTASLIFTPILNVGLLRFLLRGDEWPRPPFYLGYGADELRIVLGSLLTFLIFLAATVATLLAGGGAAYAAGHLLSLENEIVAYCLFGAIGIVGMIVIFWLMVRLSLFVPASIATKSLGIGQSWALSKRNAWLLFVYLMLLAAPLVALSFVDGALLGSSAITRLVQYASGEPMTRTLMIYAFGSVLVQAVLIIVNLIGVAFAYRILKSDETA